MLARDRLSVTIGDSAALEFELRESRSDLLKFNRLCAEWRDSRVAKHERRTSVLTDTNDEFTDERQLGFRLMSDSEAAALFFRCEFHEYCYGRRPRVRLAVYASDELARIIPRREAQGGEVGDLNRVLVRVRVDQGTALQSTWWWFSPDTRRGVAASPPFGLYCQEDEELLHEAANGKRLIARIQASSTFQFDLAAARDDLLEFTQRCAAWRTAEREDKASQAASDVSDPDS